MEAPARLWHNGKSAPHRYTNAAVTRLVLGLWSSVIEHIVAPNCHPLRVGNLRHRRLPRTTFALGLATRFRALAGLAESITGYLALGNLPGEWKLSYHLMTATHPTIRGLVAGRVLGVDQASALSGRRLHAPRRRIPAGVLTTASRHWAAQPPLR